MDTSNKKLTGTGSMNSDPHVSRTLRQYLNIGSDLVPETPKDAFDTAFKPRGAFAVFVLLILFGMGVWFAIYFLMLSRI